MSRELTDGEIKALFRQLVKAAGGVEAAAVELGIKHQRVSVLQSQTAPDMPTFRQIMRLEMIAGQDIVTGAASRAITGQETEARPSSSRAAPSSRPSAPPKTPRPSTS